MAITIDYSQSVENGFVINIPKADMTLVETTPTEVRELNVDDFRAVLNDLMDDDDGMAQQVNHEHTAPKTVGGITYARFVVILEPYTITFEDDTYNVNLVGGNNNIQQITNKNQVGVNPSNSAGSTEPAVTIEDLRKIIYPLYGQF